MMTFDLKYYQDAESLARVLAAFQLHGVEYRLSYDAGLAYVTPHGAKQ